MRVNALKIILLQQKRLEGEMHRYKTLLNIVVMTHDFKIILLFSEKYFYLKLFTTRRKRIFIRLGL